MLAQKDFLKIEIFVSLPDIEITLDYRDIHILIHIKDLEEHYEKEDI